MASDDLALLKQMHQRGEITDEQYDVLRRHVLWGTPLPEVVEEAAAPPEDWNPPPGPPGTPPRHRAGNAIGSPRHASRQDAAGGARLPSRPASPGQAWSDPPSAAPAPPAPAS